MDAGGTAGRLLERLQGVRSNGDSRWMARCPAHSDKAASLSLREVDDGRLLVNCFAGCGASEVMEAVGLELKDLYPKPLYHRGKPVEARHTHAARYALRTVAGHARFVAIVAEMLANEQALDDAAREKLRESASEIQKAAGAV